MNQEPMWTKSPLSKGKKEIVRRSADKIYAPCFHTWGVDKNKSLAFGYVSGYRYNDWRERKKEHMLHFRDNIYLRAGKAVRRYFDRLYKLPHKACRKNNGQTKITKARKEDGELSSSSSSSSSSSGESSEDEAQEKTESEEHQSTCSGTYSCQSCKARRKGELIETGSESDEIR